MLGLHLLVEVLAIVRPLSRFESYLPEKAIDTHELTRPNVVCWPLGVRNEVLVVEYLVRTLRQVSEDVMEHPDQSHSSMSCLVSKYLLAYL